MTPYGIGHDHMVQVVLWCWTGNWSLSESIKTFMNKILTKIKKKIIQENAFEKWQQFCSDLNVLIYSKLKQNARKWNQ